MLFKKKRKHLDPNTEISEFNKSLKLIADKDLLKKYVVSKIKQVAKVDKVYFFLHNNELNRFFLFGNPLEQRELSFSINDKLIFWLSSNESYLELKKSVGIFNFFSEKERSMLKKMETEMIFPLKVMNQLRGMVLLSAKTDEEEYTTNEKEILTNILDQTAFALENVSLHTVQRERINNMYRADRLSIMGELAAGAAHEIRNPLTSIRSTIQYLRKYLPSNDQKELAEGLIDEVDRINEILQGLISFARPNDPETETVDLHQLIEQILQLLASTVRKKNVDVDFQFHSQVKEISADRPQLKQVLINVILNAIQAVDFSGEIKIIVEQSTPRDASISSSSELYIIIQDNGCGIEQEHLDHIFDPFYTTKDEGTGLGLSISYGIINKHGGDIKIESEKGEGTTVTISIPYFI